MTDHFVSLRYSNDGAHNWSNSRELDAGQTGDFIKEMVARRLGMARHRVWEITDTSPFCGDILAASIEMTSE